VHLSPKFSAAQLQGVTIHPENALQFDFLIDKGDQVLVKSQKREEYRKLVKYFFSSLTIPDGDQWVNLSPYEKDRIIKDDFGKTEMGRDLLAEDYMLKQITSSLIYPENGLGKKFWAKIYERAWKEYHTGNVPVDTFNKVWIIPDHAIVYESGNTAYILQSHLKVMLEEDYLALQKQLPLTPSLTKEGGRIIVPPLFYKEGVRGSLNSIHTIASQIIREIILPELEKEVNEGKNFANLRQMYSGMILATWYKKALKESLLGKIYADKAKLAGFVVGAKDVNGIYQRYLRAFKKGVFNYIKEDVDKYTKEAVPRKYFSGGWKDFGMTVQVTPKMVGRRFSPGTLFVVNSANARLVSNLLPKAFVKALNPNGKQMDLVLFNLVPEDARLSNNKVGNAGHVRKSLVYQNAAMMNADQGLGEYWDTMAARMREVAEQNDSREAQRILAMARTKGNLSDGYMRSLEGIYARGGHVRLKHAILVNDIGQANEILKELEKNLDEYNLDLLKSIDAYQHAFGQQKAGGLGQAQKKIYLWIVNFYNAMSKGSIDLARQILDYARRYMGLSQESVRDFLEKTHAKLINENSPTRNMNIEERLDAKDRMRKIDLVYEALKNDSAMRNEIKNNYGGIDFNSANFDLQIKRDGKGVPLPLALQDMAQLDRIQGFEPEILEIRPVVHIPIISELKQKLQTSSV